MQGARRDREAPGHPAHRGVAGQVAYDSGEAASVWLDCRVVRPACTDARGCRAGLPGGGQVRGGCREAEDGHVAVGGLVLSGPDAERLVPDPDVTRGSDGAVELPPRLQVRQVPVPGEPGGKP